jgi:hypothetical protein
MKHIDCFWYYGHFHNVDSTDPQAWEVIPSSDVLFDFSLQWFTVFIKKVFGEDSKMAARGRKQKECFLK